MSCRTLLQRVRPRLARRAEEGGDLLLRGLPVRAPSPEGLSLPLPLSLSSSLFLPPSPLPLFLPLPLPLSSSLSLSPTLPPTLPPPLLLLRSHSPTPPFSPKKTRKDMFFVRGWRGSPAKPC